jgi:hypothetical protein
MSRSRALRSPYTRHAPRIHAIPGLSLVREAGPALRTGNWNGAQGHPGRDIGCKRQNRQGLSPEGCAMSVLNGLRRKGSRVHGMVTRSVP